jgi:hypothetical protein
MNAQEQEDMARDHLRPKKMIIAALAIGALFFWVSRGLPWFSGFPQAAMGRKLISVEGMNFSFFLLGVLHFTMALISGWIISLVIYRLNWVPALAAGSVVGLVLYGINFAVFNFLIRVNPDAEVFPLITHLGFALIFTSLYKAISVPRASRRPLHS